VQEEMEEDQEDYIKQERSCFSLLQENQPQYFELLVVKEIFIPWKEIPL
jgi:hypothetical protein